MLHPLPDTHQRRYMHFVCGLQRRLVRDLCKLPQGSSVDGNWLRKLWDDVDQEWVESFWGDKDGPRNRAMNVIAKASRQTKRAIWKATVQQTRVRRLYTSGRSPRITVMDWKAPKTNPTHDEIAREAFAELMRSFYDRGLKKGFVLKAGRISYASILNTGMANTGVCPFCDGKLDARNRVIDHFFPQESFPALTCFIDNLIPICDTCNGPRAKLAKLPFSPTANNEVDVDDWFHPRWRLAKGKVIARVIHANNRPEVTIVASTAGMKRHVHNLVQLTAVNISWNDRISPELRQEEERVASELSRLKAAGCVVDRTVAIKVLVGWRDYYDKNVGNVEWAIKLRGIYEYLASDEASIKEILEQVSEQ